MYLQLEAFVVVVVDDEADASELVVCNPQRHHPQHLHVLQAAVTAGGQRDLLLHTQVNAGQETHTHTQYQHRSSGGRGADNNHRCCD